MLTEGILKLTRKRIEELLKSRSRPESDYQGHERRRHPRWPFPGAVELRPVGANDDELCFGTCRDISLSGVGLTCDEEYAPGTQLEIALHLPEATFWGKGTVRFCRELDADFDEEYVLGIEFNFEK